jgi:hypothetical protein
MDHGADLLTVLEGIGQRPAPIVEATPPPATGWKASPVTRKTLFVHHDTHPVVYDVALLKEYGVDWFEWEAATLWSEILRDFKVPSISDHAKTKIQAIKTLHISESFWTEWEVFGWISQALNNNIPDWQTMQKPSIGQLLNAVDVATLVRADEVFSPEVQGYVAASILDEGVLYAPDELKFCQPDIDLYAASRPVEDYASIVHETQTRYLQLRGGASLDLQENAVDVQVAKLKVAWDYLTKRREQLKEQLLLLT